MAKMKRSQVVFSESEHERLSSLAKTMANRLPEVCENLQYELERSKVVPDAKIGDEIVQMGSEVELLTSNGEQKTVTLVFPGEADISLGKISVMTPMGVALIGTPSDMVVVWEGRGGREQSATVISVRQPHQMEAAHMSA